MKNYSLGNFIYELRMKLGLSQTQLGALVGVSNKAVSKWENGSAQPKLLTLHKLANAFGLTLDELLSCKYPDPAGTEKGTFAMKNELWKQTHDRMTELYGSCPPLEVLARYEAEKLFLDQHDMIVHFHFLSKLVTYAQEQRSAAFVVSEINSSFIAWLLGITVVNPLRPHHHCPVCHRTIFYSNDTDGWDLPERHCECGSQMIRDGHLVPCESALTRLSDSLAFEIRIPQALSDSARALLEAYYEDAYRLLPVELPYPGAQRYLLLPKEQETAALYKDKLSLDDYLAHYRSYPSFLFLSSPRMELLHHLLTDTNRTTKHIDFLDCSVLKQYRCASLPDILTEPDPYTNTPFRQPAHSFAEILHYYGYRHLIATDHISGHPLDNAFVFREDLYLYLIHKLQSMELSDTGFALHIADSIYKGRYASRGMPREAESALRSLSVPPDLIEHMKRIIYLFPKGYSIAFLHIEMLLVWFSLHEPQVFSALARKHLQCHLVTAGNQQ